MFVSSRLSACCFVLKRAPMAVCLGVVLATASWSPAHAQDGAQPAKAAAQATFTQDQVDAYMKALTKIVDVNIEYQPKFDAAADDDARGVLSEELTEKMQAAIKDEGLSNDQYESIGKNAQAYPGLQERIQAVLNPDGAAMPAGHPTTSMPAGHPGSPGAMPEGHPGAMPSGHPPVKN